MIYFLLPGSRSTFPELDLDPDPDPAKWYGSNRIRIWILIRIRNNATYISILYNCLLISFHYSIFVLYSVYIVPYEYDFNISLNIFIHWYSKEVLNIWPIVSTARLIMYPQLWQEVDFWECFYRCIKIL